MIWMKFHINLFGLFCGVKFTVFKAVLGWDRPEKYKNITGKRVFRQFRIKLSFFDQFPIFIGG